QGTLMLGGHVIVGGVLSATVRSFEHCLMTPPGRLSVTLTVTDPGWDVVTITVQLVTFVHEFGPTKEAPAVLLIRAKTALNVPFVRNGLVAVNETGVPHSAADGPETTQYENCALATGVRNA